MDLFNDVSYGAEFSSCRRYRYRLWRIWNKQKPLAMVIGLNPSTADQTRNDPTIQNLMKMLNTLDFGGFYMMNLYAWISSNPKDLKKVDNPEGCNISHLLDIKQKCDKIIVAWGTFNEAKDIIHNTLSLFDETYCFGINQDGTPFHPLAMMYKGLVKTPSLKKYYPGEMPPSG